METLATIDDLQARLQRTLTADEITRAEALLVDASATVRNYARQSFTEEETTSRVRVRNGKVRLPQRPVTAIDSIADMNGNDVSFTWYAGDVIEFNSLSSSEWVIEPYTTTVTWLDVTYTHGYDTVPETVVKIVCRLAATALDTPAEDAGKQSESIQGYSYSVGSVAASGGLFSEEKRELDAYRLVGGSSRIGI